MQPSAGSAVDINTLTAMSFVDREHGFAVSEDTSEIAATTDGGKTWRTVSEVPVAEWRFGVADGTAVAQIAFVDTKRGFVWGDGKIFFTDDGGHTWVSRDSGGPVNEVRVTDSRLWALVGCDPQGPPALCKSRLEVSDDAGASWRATAIPDASSTQTPLLAVVDVETVYTLNLADEAVVPKIAVTHDGGNTWVRRDAPCLASGNISMAVSAAERLWLVCYPGNELQTSTDEGATWTRVTSPDATMSFDEIRVVGDAAVIGGLNKTCCEREIAASTDAGASWHVIGSYTSGEYLLSEKRGTGAWLLTHGPRGAQLAFSSDETTWEPVGAQGPFATRRDLTHLRAVDWVDDQHAFAAMDRGLATTDDGGRTWRLVGSKAVDNPIFVDTLHGIDYRYSDVSQWTDDGGAHWHDLDIGAIVSATKSGHTLWAAIACVPARAVDACTIKRSTDGGKSWESSRAPDVLAVPAGEHQGATVWTPVDDNTVFLTVQPSPVGRPVPVWRTVDRGETWTPVQTPCGTDWQVVIGASDAEHLWVHCVDSAQTPRARLFRSDDGGTTWSEIATSGLPVPGEHALRAYRRVAACPRRGRERRHRRLRRVRQRRLGRDVAVGRADERGEGSGTRGRSGRGRHCDAFQPGRRHLRDATLVQHGRRHVDAAGLGGFFPRRLNMRPESQLSGSGCSLGSPSASERLFLCPSR